MSNGKEFDAGGISTGGTSDTLAEQFDADVVEGGPGTPTEVAEVNAGPDPIAHAALVEEFDAEGLRGGTSDTVAEQFDAETVVVGGWFGNLFSKIKKAAGGALALIQTKDGVASVDALKKAADMVTAARGGDKEQQQKIEAVADSAARGDPAAKQATGLLQMANDLAKKAEAQGKTAAEIYAPVDGSKAGIGYSWDW